MMQNNSKYLIRETATIKEALISLNNLSDDVLVLFVVNKDKQLIGTLTDGDIRRFLISGGGLFDLINKAMQRNFHYMRSDINPLIIKEYKNQGFSLIPFVDEYNKLIKVFNLKKYKSILPIDVVLMAGGKGERLRPLTNNIPKPLLPVGNKVIIDHNIESLISYGIENIFVTVNYLHEQIEAHFKEKKKGIQIKCVKEPKYLGTIGSVKFVECLENETVLVMNSDVFTNINYEDFFLHFKKGNSDMSIAVIPYSVSVPYGILQLEKDNVQGIKEKPTYNHFANAGLYLIKKELLDIIPKDVFYDATDFINALILMKKKISYFPITGYWIDIGKNEDYKKAQELSYYIQR
ncbi:MAG: UTP--glucose-1-phosphate uridylyltransferase [Parabacteroides sp.]